MSNYALHSVYSLCAQGKCKLDEEDKQKYLHLGAALDANGYVVVYLPKTKSRVKLHTLILVTSLDVDHINGDRSDNRKCNLREATRSQNLWNSEISSRNTSGAKGVDFMKNKNKWRVRITAKKGVVIHVGTYNTFEEAVAVYNKKALYYHGEFARLNNV